MGNDTDEDLIERVNHAVLASEDWAKGYQKNPEALAKLIKLESKLDRVMRAYFRTLADERLQRYINWSLYQLEAIKAYSYTVIVDVDEFDSEEDVMLMNVLHDPLALSIALGAQTAETQYNIELGLNQYSDAVMKIAEKYTAELVKGINNTTKDRLKQAISTSIRLGEDQKAASARIEAVIGDVKRARMIARTEAVRSYSTGIQVFGEESNATRMYWELSSDPCELCLQAYQDWGGADGIPFDSGMDPPPEHPNCRCGNSLSHSYE